QNLRRHAATGVLEDQLGQAVVQPLGDRERAALVHAVQGVDDQVEHDRFDFLRVDPGDQAIGHGEANVLAAAVGQVLHDFEHTLDELAELGRLAAALAAAAEIQQLLNDLLATEGLFLNHLQILRDDLAVLIGDGLGAGKQVYEPAIEGLAAKGNA